MLAGAVPLSRASSLFILSVVCLTGSLASCGSGTKPGTSAVTLSCLEGWWINSTAGCGCGSSADQPECSGGDCKVLGIQGYDADGSTWWSFDVSVSAQTGTMSTWGYGERGTYSFAGDMISVTGDNTFIQDVESCSASTSTVDFILSTRVSMNAAASFAAAVQQYGAKTEFSWKQAPYSP